MGQHKVPSISCHCREYLRICANIGSLLVQTIVGQYTDICQYMVYLLHVVVESISKNMPLLGQHMNMSSPCNFRWYLKVNDNHVLQLSRQLMVWLYCATCVVGGKYGAVRGFSVFIFSVFVMDANMCHKRRISVYYKAVTCHERWLYVVEGDLFAVEDEYVL